MAASLPRGFVCSSELRALYPAIEKRMEPIIRAKSWKISRWLDIDIDDAIQEGRIALLAAMARFDYNKSGGKLDNYIAKVITNTYNGIMYDILNSARMPRATVRGPDGDWVEVPRPPMSLDGLLDVGYEPESNLAAPDREIMEGANLGAIKKFKMRVMFSLKKRDRDVFMCKVNPPVDFLKMVENLEGDIDKPTNIHIAKYLDLGKNAVDLSLFRIRSAFIRLAQPSEFSDLFGDTLEGRGWPVIYISRAPKHDVEFVQRIIRERNLDPKPVTGYHTKMDFWETAGEYARLIERYPWGVVLVLKAGVERRTVVIEGKFNPNDGTVIGLSGGRRELPVKWYAKLVRSLKRRDK